MTASSKGVTTEERIDWWRALLADTFVPFEVSAETRGFHAELRVGYLGAVVVSDTESCPQVAQCTNRTISSTDHDFYNVGLQIHGSCVVQQGDRTTTLEPGDLTIYDCTRPVELTFQEPWRMLAFMFPRNLLKLHPHTVDDVIARRISSAGGTAGIVIPFLKSLAAQRGHLAPQTAHQLADTTLDLLRTLLTELPGGPTYRDAATSALMLRVQHYIDRNLSDPDLSPEQIAAAHHISVRYLYKIFDTGDTTVARYIRERRLERCRRDLADHRLRSKPVGALAASWGFVNPAHFSRLFKATYDASPREYRLRCGAVGNRPDRLIRAVVG
ncbi:helix-turn-helix domain-containing protein [Nocardia vinacea]|uniref:AraC-like ligand-binding domain-containing protein n=1 Tax=Nocardia vinacea TaxID=96468 RepID=UPI0034185468